MKKSFITLLVSILMSTNVMASTWATAVSEHETDGTSIVYRYVKEFDKNFNRADKPMKIIITWRFKGEKGMPNKLEVASMNKLEDSLARAVEADDRSTLVLVSTGAGLREWVFYTESDDAFMEKLNVALHMLEPFPIELFSIRDPEWKHYKEFIEQVEASPKYSN